MAELVEANKALVSKSSCSEKEIKDSRYLK